MNRDTSFPALAVVPPGLEAAAAAELEALGADQVRTLRRAVAFHGTSRHFYRVLLRARLPLPLSSGKWRGSPAMQPRVALHFGIQNGGSTGSAGYTPLHELQASMSAAGQSGAEP